MKLLFAGVLAVLCPAVLWCQTPTIVVRFHTNLGDIDVNMIPVAAPDAVENFLGYVNRGDYNNSVIHRSVPAFIVQGGGYQLKDHKLVEIPQKDPVPNRFSITNARGTLAMAKLDGDPNSATNQWFFNLRDNSKTLNLQNGGFTVFGRIIPNSPGFDVLDKIEDLHEYQFTSPFDQIPLIDYTSGNPTDDNYVTVISVSVLGAAPAINPGGVISTVNFGGFPAAAGGSFVEIYGANLAGTSREWSGSDFVAGNAPTTLDNVSATVGGVPAYVYYVSPGQVNVQVPANAPLGDAQVVVSYQGRASGAVPVSIKATAGGLYAPPSFKVDGKQFVAALHSSTGAYVSNGSIPGLPAAPAVPGETLSFFGIGFGPVTSGAVPVAGQIVKEFSPVATPVEFRFGDVLGNAVGGLVPGSVGLYQFNVTVPKDAPAGDVALTVTQGGLPIAQTLSISLQK